VEVTHINNLVNRNDIFLPPNHTSQIRNMARHVQELFPRYPLSILMTDLQASRSIEITIDNILEGRLLVPARFDMDDADDTGAGLGDDTGNNVATTFTSASDYYVSEFAPLQTTFATISQAHNTNYVTPPSASGYDVQNFIFGNQNDLQSDDNVSEELPFDRFSKSSEERERILQKRKEHLVNMARKKYLEKNKSELNIPTSSGSNLVYINNRPSTSSSSE
jgi:E3 ubiquitin-protein ligase AMFR